MRTAYVSRGCQIYFFMEGILGPLVLNACTSMMLIKHIGQIYPNPAIVVDPHRAMVSKVLQWQAGST